MVRRTTPAVYLLMIPTLLATAGAFLGGRDWGVLGLYGWLVQSIGHEYVVGVLAASIAVVIPVSIAAGVAALIGMSTNSPTTSIGGRLPVPVTVGHTATGEPVYSTAVTPPPQMRTNTMAILALCFGVMGGILGIVFGHIALSQIKRTGEQGRGMAIAGLILGYIGLAALIAWFIFLAVFLNSINSY